MPEAPRDASEAPVSLKKRRFSATAVKERIIRSVLQGCALVSIATTLGIILVLVSESLFAFEWTIPVGESQHTVTFGDPPAFFQQISFSEFFAGTEWSPLFADKHFGVLPLLAGTLMVALIAAVIGLPLGLAAALYLSEYASMRKRTVIKPVLEVLAGIPTVVYGYFALVFITPALLRPIFQDGLGFEVVSQNVASAGIVVGIMILPMVSSMSEDALRSVPQGLREAGYALGSTKFDVSMRVVLPAASSGIVASFLLAIARAVGETMAVTIAAGLIAQLTANPFQSMQTMTAYIVQATSGDAPAGTIEYKSLYAVGLTLFVITLSMNLISQRVLRRFREVYE